MAGSAAGVLIPRTESIATYWFAATRTVWPRTTTSAEPRYTDSTDVLSLCTASLNCAAPAPPGPATCASAPGAVTSTLGRSDPSRATLPHSSPSNTCTDAPAALPPDPLVAGPAR